MCSTVKSKTNDINSQAANTYYVDFMKQMIFHEWSWLILKHPQVPAESDGEPVDDLRFWNLQFRFFNPL